MMELLYLNEGDVTKLLDMPGAISVVEEAFLEHGMGRTQMPPKSYLYFPAGDLRTMPAYLETAGIAGVKIVNVHPKNPEAGLPTVMAVVVLNSIETGAPLAVMDGTYLTEMRTGAAGGVAADRLARSDATVVGMVGVGRQARTQLRAICEVRSIEAVKITGRSDASCRRFIDDTKDLGCEITVMDGIRQVCDCDILVTTTPVREPIVADGWIPDGTHINAIGADAAGKEELDPEILRRSRIVDDDEITVFDSTGLAIQDVSTANHVYQQAVRKGIGTHLKLF
jgi:alanine dehydrogenase